MTLRERRRTPRARGGRLLLVIAGACAALSAARPAPAAAEALPRVGVVIATRVNVPEPEAAALAAHLGEAIRRELKVDVIAGPAALRRLEPGGVPEHCVARADCVRDVAARLGAAELVFLVMVRISPRLQIDATWADPETGAAAGRPPLVVEEGGPAPELVLARAPRRLLPHAAPRLAGAVEADRPQGRGRARRITPAVGLTAVLGGVALATGAGLAISARRDFDALEADGCDVSRCPDEDGRVARMERKALVADIVLVTAAAAGVTSLVLYLRSDETEPRVQVSAGQRGAFVSYGGRF